jgi:hypothetical protein
VIGLAVGVLIVILVAAGTFTLLATFALIRRDGLSRRLLSRPGQFSGLDYVPLALLLVVVACCWSLAAALTLSAG